MGLTQLAMQQIRIMSDKKTRLKESSKGMTLIEERFNQYCQKESNNQ